MDGLVPTSVSELKRKVLYNSGSAEMKIYWSGCLIILMTLSSCSLDDDPIKDGFSIYLLQGSSTNFQEAEEIGLNNVELEDVAWLEPDDISLYDFSTHYISLKIDKASLFQGMLDDGHMFNFLVKPFVIVAGGERIAFGSFISSYSSIMSSGPHIYDLENLFLPSDILFIHRDGGAEIDIRNDERIKNALIAGDVYHAGVNVELMDVEILDNSDTATVRYSFIIRNNDSDDLYIPDPDLMGTALFHYYTNGVELRDSDNHYYYSQYKSTSSPVPHDSWESAWFLKLESGSSIRKNLVLKGYPQFPEDTYRCYFKYAGPSKIALNDRVIQDGRYWIGETETNSITIAY